MTIIPKSGNYHGQHWRVCFQSHLCLHTHTTYVTPADSTPSHTTCHTADAQRTPRS